MRKIMIVDDHPMFREALSQRIGMEKEFEVCGEADNEQEALQRLDELHPDLLLVDISLKSGNGIELVKQVRSRFPGVKQLVISTHAESLYAERALRAGADGYVNKQQPSEDVITAIRSVLEGQRYISEEVTQRLVERALGEPFAEVDPVEMLSDRELEVFRLIGEGMTSSAIADRLGLSIHTIDTYREKIKHKIGVKNSVELQREAVRWKMENE
ncbi:MAG: response regulator transcription factor [Pirellulaceae bacterium]